MSLTFLVRAIHLDQPIVENYVGRQIPTAMVARNIERGSGFLRPQLDTGPFPNLFLVEPPIYAMVVATTRWWVGLDLEPTGRLVSAFGTLLGAWGLYALVRRRDGFAVALAATVAFASFPVMIRYGRAFQPDALMVGFVLAGLALWDAFQESGRWAFALLGGFVFAMGLALKVTSAWALLPFWVVATRLSPGERVGFVLAMLAPAIAWYLHAWGDVGHPRVGSLASSANASIWLHSMAGSGWVRFSTYDNLSRALLYRSFTPIGFVLAAWAFARPHPSPSSPSPLGPSPLVGEGLGGGSLGRTLDVDEAMSRAATPSLASHANEITRPAMTSHPNPPPQRGRGSEGRSIDVEGIDRLWQAWGIGCLLSILILAPKWHHAYYWMVVVPLVAVGVGRRIVQVRSIHPKIGFVLAFGFLGLCGYQSASTWETPVEWAGLVKSADQLKQLVPGYKGIVIVAPEALLYYSDRRGYRLEFDPDAARRAAKEWGRPFDDSDPTLALLRFYEHNARAYGDSSLFSKRPAGVDYAADVGLADADHPRRRAWRAAVRGLPGIQILVDEPDALIVKFR